MVKAWLVSMPPTTMLRDGVDSDEDEAEMEPMDVWAEDVRDGSFLLVAEVRDGPVDGPYVFAYSIGTGDSMNLTSINATLGITGDGAGNVGFTSVRSLMFSSGLTGGGFISQGSGAPVKPGGVNPVAGDIYFRTDTPSTVNQRIYICTVGGGSPTWVGIV